MRLHGWPTHPHLLLMACSRLGQMAPDGVEHQVLEWEGLSAFLASGWVEAAADAAAAAAVNADASFGAGPDEGGASDGSGSRSIGGGSSSSGNGGDSQPSSGEDDGNGGGGNGSVLQGAAGKCGWCLSEQPMGCAAVISHVATAKHWHGSHCCGMLFH